MEWKEYLQERINAAPILAKEQTKNAPAERAVILRMMSFANQFFDGRGDSRIIILYGLRGIGKSTILFQMYNRLRTGNFYGTELPAKRIAQENILYLSVDQASLTTQSKTESIVYDAIKNFCEQIHNQKLEALNKKLFVLIDEAQFDKKWALAAKSIFDATKNIFIVITGSSALALNIDTDTARRAIKEPLFPLSFMEYQMMKHKIYPTKGTADRLKKLILQNDRTTITELNACVKKIQEDNKKIGKTIDAELQEYMTLGGFPYGIISSKEVAYRRIIDMINRIVSQDMPEICNYETDSIPEIMRIVGAIALKKSGELPQTKLSQSLGISSAKVNNIIDSLQKTHLVFTVKPIPLTSDKGLNRGFKYYLMSPTLLSALKYMNGTTTFNPEEMSLLWENAVASTLFKLCYTTGTIYSLLYDPRKDTNVDFLLQNPISGRIIPIEVGLNKDDKQANDAVEFYKADYGIVVSDYPEIMVTDKLIRIPFWVFFYM
ncbi:MAG: AAA family ATPase [Candidatus Woesearchaeota archaeon]